MIQKALAWPMFVAGLTVFVGSVDTALAQYGGPYATQLQANPTASYGGGYVVPRVDATPATATYRAPMGSAFSGYAAPGRWEGVQPQYLPSGRISLSTPEQFAGYTPNTVFPSASYGSTAYRPVMPAAPGYSNQLPNGWGGLVSPTTALSPVATPGMYVGRPVTQAPVVDNFAPRNFYRSSYYPTPVTYYRPVVAQDPVTGGPVTVLQPCTGYEYQARRQFSLFGGMFDSQPRTSYAPASCPNCGPGYGNGFVGGVPGGAPAPGAGPAIPVAPRGPVGVYPPPGGLRPGVAPPGTRIPGSFGGVPADSRPTLSPDNYAPGTIDRVPRDDGRLIEDESERRTEYGSYDRGAPDSEGWRDVPRGERPIRERRVESRRPAYESPASSSRRIAPSEDDWRDVESRAVEPSRYESREYRSQSDSSRDRDSQSDSARDRDWRDTETRREHVRRTIVDDRRVDDLRDDEYDYRSTPPTNTPYDRSDYDKKRREIRERPIVPSGPPSTKPSTRSTEEEGPSLLGPRGQAKRSAPIVQPNEPDESDAVVPMVRRRSSWRPQPDPSPISPVRDDQIQRPRLPRMTSPPLLDSKDRSTAAPRDERLSHRATETENPSQIPVWAFVKVDWRRPSDSPASDEREADRPSEESSGDIEMLPPAQSESRSAGAMSSIAPEAEVASDDDAPRLAPARSSSQKPAAQKPAAQPYGDHRWKSMKKTGQ